MAQRRGERLRRLTQPNSGRYTKYLVWMSFLGWPLECKLGRTVRVLPKFVVRELTVVLSLLLLFSATVVCWAQLVHPMLAADCCSHGDCKKMPPGSSCRRAPVNPVQSVPAVVTPGPVTLAQVEFVSAEPAPPITTPYLQPFINYSPPDLFLVHSSFLI